LRIAVLKTRHLLRLAALFVLLSFVGGVITLSLLPAERPIVVPTLMVLPTADEANGNAAGALQAAAAATNSPPPRETPAPTTTPTASRTASPTSTATATATVDQISTPIASGPLAGAPPTAAALPARERPIEVVLPPPPPPDQAIISFAPETDEAERAAYLDAIGATVTETIDALNAVVVSLPEALDELPVNPAVIAAEPDYFVTVQLAVPPSDPFYPQQWALDAIGAPAAWSAINGSLMPVTVAVIDTGICADLPDLAGRVLPGWDYVDDDNDPRDEFGHGCGVASIIAANIDDGVGMAGIAPNARILPLRVLNAAGIGSYSDVAAAIVRAADEGAQVINLSLGGSQPSLVLELAVNYATGRGAIVIAAAGNTGRPGVLYPAAYANAIAVASVDAALQPSGFNATGPEVAAFAPGQSVLALRPDGTYASMSGTSFAAPHASGAAALLLGRGDSFVVDGGLISVATGLPATPTPVVTATPSPTTEFVNLGGEEDFEVEKPAIAALSSRLWDLYSTYDENAAQALLQGELYGLEIDGARVQVMIFAADAAAAERIIAALPGLGAEVTAHYDSWIDAWIAIGALDALAALPGVLLVDGVLPVKPVQPHEDGERPAGLEAEPDPMATAAAVIDALDEGAVIQTGAFVTQGVTASNANVWHADGWTGAGVRVAVLDQFRDYVSAQAAGELPQGGNLNVYGTLDFSSRHGTAVAEIIYDMAPGVQMWLASPNTVTEMAQTIVTLAQPPYNVRIIASSIGFSGIEPGDGTGPISNAINTAYNIHGALYVQAAGNARTIHWDGFYRDTESTPDGRHEWTTGIVTPGLDAIEVNEIGTLSAGSRISLTLRWNEWPTTNKDYDLYLVRWSGSSWVNVASSTNDQTGGGALPVEHINFTVPTTGLYGVRVNRFPANAPHAMYLTLMGYAIPGGFQYQVTDRSLIDQATASGSFAVAALNVNSPFSLEWYSSRGPARATGNQWTVPGNAQPRIAGFARVNTWSYGNNVFNGTSAAQPHVSGAAALVMQRFPHFSAADVRSFLESRAIDMGPAGYDHDFGAGRLWLGSPFVATPTPTFTPTPPTAPPNTNLIANGTFSAGLANWGTWNATAAASSGVLAITRNAGTADGGFWQQMGFALPANAPVELRLQLGNGASVPKSIDLVVRSSTWSGFAICSFTLPPNTPLQNVTMRLRTNAAWPMIVLQGYLAPADGLMGVLIDNVDLRYQPGMAVTNTECSLSAPVGPNLISNGDFSNGLNNWGTWNSTATGAGGLMTIARGPGTADGGFWQQVGNSFPANTPLELTVQLGNSSSVLKNVTLVLRRPDWSEFYTCNINLPPNWPLQQVTMRIRTGSAWPALVYQGYLAPADGLMGVRMDNVELRVRPGMVVNPNPECAVAPPSNVNLISNGTFNAGLANWGTWNATATTTGGILTIARNPGTPGGGFWQQMAAQLPPNSPIELNMQIGNSSAVNKQISIVFRNTAFTDYYTCSLLLPPNLPLQNFRMRFRNATEWPTIIFQPYLSPADGLLGITVDNVDVRYRPDLTVTNVECAINATGVIVTSGDQPLPTLTPTPTATETATATATATETATATVTATATPSLTMTPTETATMSATPTATETAAATDTPEPTQTPTALPTLTPVPTEPPTEIPTAAPTPEPPTSEPPTPEPATPELPTPDPPTPEPPAGEHDGG
jgi:thermitase